MTRRLAHSTPRQISREYLQPGSPDRGVANAGLRLEQLTSRMARSLTCSLQLSKLDSQFEMANSLQVCWVGLFLVIGSCWGASNSGCPMLQGLHPNLIRFITKEGFHREVEESVEVTITNSAIPPAHFLSSQCRLALLAKFPPAVYVDPYELAISPAYDHIRVLNNWTDLESPAWLASSNSTLLIHLSPVLTGNLVSTEPIRLPIHYRYQKPRSHSSIDTAVDRRTGLVNPAGYTPVSLPLPQLLLRCEDWDADSLTSCPTTALCGRGAEESHNCVWLRLPYKANAKSGTVQIPVGDSDSQTIVTLLTLTVVAGGMLFLLSTLIQAARNSRQQPN